MDRELHQLALAVRERAYAPYSRYKVGAAVRTEAGTLHAGCNVENGSYPEGWCAETSALARMVAEAGPGSRLVAVAVVAERMDGRLVTPCGGCRQRLAEFGGPDTVVHVADPQGGSASYRLADLLPQAFAFTEQPS